VNQVYNIIKDEAIGAKVTLDEVKNLFHFVKEKTGDVTIAHTSNDEVDLADLVNAIMDASIDLGDEKPVLNETGQTGVSNRYSGNDNQAKKPAMGMVSKDEYQSLQE
jgi:hypothetical protein